MQEEFCVASTELGKAKEFQLYYEINKSQGKIWRTIKLPLFRVIKKNYYTEIGDEIDLYCETLRGKIWVFELKFKTKQIGQKEIDKFLSKTKADIYVFVAKNGFVSKVIEKYLGNKKVILISLSV